MNEPPPLRMSCFQFLVYQSVLRGTPWPLVKEAVASVAIEHPEWDMEETKTWVEWEGSLQSDSSNT